MAKRLISTAIGIIILILVMITNNVYIFNIALMIIGMIGIHEFYNAFKTKGAKPIPLIGYIATLGLLFVNKEIITSSEQLKNILILALPILVLVLFCKSVFSNMKNNIEDIAITLFGVIYIPFFLMFLTLTRQLQHGELLVWYILLGAWVTDTFAYLIGVKFGKHKFSKVSPKKSIEGSVAGIIATSIVFGIYTNIVVSPNLELTWAEMAFVGIIISLISQIGDLSASSIKRYCGIKDFGSIMPGHGGILDRFDSIIMISPFVYIFLQILL